MTLPRTSSVGADRRDAEEVHRAARRSRTIDSATRVTAHVLEDEGERRGPEEADDRPACSARGSRPPP